MLRAFITSHRDEILAGARVRVKRRVAPTVTKAELAYGIPLFLTQLGEALARLDPQEESLQRDISLAAAHHGEALFQRGFTIGQVVHDYGDLCQVITQLAAEHDVNIPVEDFQMLNLCLDHAIASAVTVYGERRERAIVDEGTERLGVFAHEMRNLLNAAVLSFACIKKGVVAQAGSTSAVHERSLMRLQALVDRSLADVRLDAGVQNRERVPVWEIVEEVEITGSMFAQVRPVHLLVTSVDHSVCVAVDRQILASALVNLLQNAFKFTQPNTVVSLRVRSAEGRVYFDVEDECGGLPAGAAENLLRPFEQRGNDRSGLGLGLAICVKAVRASGGELRIANLPGKGCVFTVDLPQLDPTAVPSPQASMANGPSQVRHFLPRE